MQVCRSWRVRPAVHSHPLPVGRTINRAPKTLLFDKGLQQHDRMPIFGSASPGRSGPATRPKIQLPKCRHLDPRQNQKTRVVGYQRQVLLPLLGGPADKPVPVLTLPGRRPENQASQGTLLPIPHDVLQVLSHRPAKAQIMKLGQCPSTQARSAGCPLTSSTLRGSRSARAQTMRFSRLQ